MKYTEKEDICAHLGDDYEKFMGAIVPPIYQNSLFVQLDTDKNNNNENYVYTRVANPTTEIAEKKIAALQEGEEARCFSSGMAAITSAIMHYVKKDCHVISVGNVYGPTRTFFETYLKKFGIEVTFISGETIEEFEKEIRPNTKLIFLESPVSYVFKMQDLEDVSKLAKHHKIATVIDNTWATPLYQNPLKYGIDLVIHTASKYLGGHSDIVAGVIVGKAEVIKEISSNERELFGGIMDPHQSWLLTRGLRTLPIRIKQHEENAMKVAKFLEENKKIKKVNYPGLKSYPQYQLGKKQMTGYSGLLSLELEFNDDIIFDFIKNLKYFQVGPSWGGFESLITSPTLGKSEEELKRLMLPKGLVRMHVGLENVNSLLEDLEKGLSMLR